MAAPGNNCLADNWSTQDKFIIDIEIAHINEAALVEYSRKKELYFDQINAWKPTRVWIKDI